ncbi:MAG: DUF4886 domain-containing protein [Kiritimatiellae bacterium]|nr:DUF4886 domain-containing protein [Kiritimatiellia bacterium]
MRLVIGVLATVLSVCVAQAKSVKVLIIGNSFSVSVMNHLPKAAEAMPGCELSVVSMYIGGCSLQRHWENVEKAGDAAFKPYDIRTSGYQGKPVGKKANIPELLTAEKWDVVTIQQASHESWKPESYHPYADRLIAKIKELAPQAEIVIQQTWSYCNADDRIRMPGAKWGFDQTGMYDRLTKNYTDLAKQYRLRVIPTGYAIQLYRQALPVTFVPPTAEARQALKRPALPDMGGEVVGKYYWQEKDGVDALRCDTIHLNRAGEYLQACVWLAFLFDADVNTLSYAPDGLPHAELIRSCARKAVKTFSF